MFGYVLDGFPKSYNQLQILHNLKITPNLIVVLECPEEELKRRIENKRVDPITGLTYDHDSVVSDPEVSSRLQPIPNQKPEIVKKRLDRWDQLLKYIEESYYNSILKISATIPPKQILEMISYQLENS
jgi:adenylate kinase